MTACHRWCPYTLRITQNIPLRRVKGPLVGDNLSADTLLRHLRTCGCLFKFGGKQTPFGKGGFHWEWTTILQPHQVPWKCCQLLKLTLGFAFADVIYVSKTKLPHIYCLIIWAGQQDRDPPVWDRGFVSRHRPPAVGWSDSWQPPGPPSSECAERYDP